MIQKHIRYAIALNKAALGSPSTASIGAKRKPSWIKEQAFADSCNYNYNHELTIKPYFKFTEPKR